MGNIRVVVETAVREVVLLLHRQQVASPAIAATQGRLLRLVAQVVSLEHATHDTRQVEMVQGQEICRSFVLDMVNKVETVICPAREVERLTAECKSLRQQLFDLEKEVTEIRKRDGEVQAHAAKHQAAHEYALRSYFREVFQLRRRHLASSSDPRLNDVNHEAIFDYEQYVALMREHDADMEQRYRALEKLYTEHVENASRDRDALSDVYKKIIQGHVKRYNALSRFVESINDRVASAKAYCFMVTKTIRATMVPIRTALATMAETLSKAQQLARAKVLQLQGLCDVLTEYSSTACRYMVDQGHSDAKLSTFSRAAFQKSLGADATDLDHVRVAKLYWRKHPITTTIVATIVEMRKVFTDRVDFSTKLKHLSGEFAAVQEHANALELQNTFLISQLASVGASVPAAVAGPLLSSSSVASSDLSKAASTKFFPQQSIPKKGESFLQPAAAGTAGSLKYVAADKVLRYTINEAQNLATAERLLVHELFHEAETGTGDASTWSRLELDIIREVAARHKQLAHHRNQAIVKACVLRQLRMKTMSRFTEAAKVAQLAEFFTADASTTLNEKLQEMEIRHQEEKALAGRAIVDNIVAMFMTLRTLPLSTSFRQRMAATATIIRHEKEKEEAEKTADPLDLRRNSGVGFGKQQTSPNSPGAGGSGHAQHGAVVGEESATQTDLNDLVEALLDDQDPKYHRFLMQTTGQFSTTRANADEGDLLRIESLQPPRCISIATTGGVGQIPTNDKSVVLMTMSSLAKQRAEQKALDNQLVGTGGQLVRRITSASPGQRERSVSTGLTLSPRAPAPPAAQQAGGVSQRVSSAAARALSNISRTPQSAAAVSPRMISETVPAGRPPTAPSQKR